MIRRERLFWRLLVGPMALIVLIQWGIVMAQGVWFYRGRDYDPIIKVSMPPMLGAILVLALVAGRYSPRRTRRRLSADLGTFGPVNEQIDHIDRELADAAAVVRWGEPPRSFQRH